MKRLCISAILAIIFVSVVSADESITNAYLGLNVGSTDTYMYSFDMGTSAAYTPSNGRLVYGYNGPNTSASATSRIVIKIDGVPMSVSSSAEAVALHVSGDTITGTRRFNGIIDLKVTWKFVVNPLTGTNEDTVQIAFDITNVDSSPHSVALRFEIDTMVLGNDGANISVNNGISVIPQNTVWYKSSGNIPPDWWDYDLDPNLYTPNLVGRGYNSGNAFPSGEPSTEPDIFEIAHWPDVRNPDQWSLAPSWNSIGSDSAVVLWWTDGSGGGPSSPGRLLQPGDSITHRTHYGLNQGVLLTPVPTVETNTPTPTPTGFYTPVSTPTSTPTGEAVLVTFSKAVQGENPHQGARLTYSIDVFNSSDEKISNINVWDSMPDNVRVIESGFEEADIVLNDHYISWDLSNGARKTLGPGEGIRIEFIAELEYISGEEPVINTAYLSYNDPAHYEGGPLGRNCNMPPAIALYPQAGVVIYPNPFNPLTAVGNILKILNTVDGTDIYILTISGELVKSVPVYSVVAEWDGKNSSGNYVSPGVYYYIIKNKTSGEVNKGKIFVISN